MTSCRNSDGTCHVCADHWPLWAVLRGTLKRHRVGRAVAFVAEPRQPLGWSIHSGARLTHRPQRCAYVRRDGVGIVMFAARWLCGAESCKAELGAVPPVGLTPCPRCEAQIPRTVDPQ